jgi:hypothetical protein
LCVPGFGHTSSNTPQTPLCTSHCPFAFVKRPAILPSPCPPSVTVPSFLPAATHGRHLNASPPTNSSPLPLTRIWLFNAKPSLVQASIEVAGAAVLRKTSRAPKSVCVSSSLFGPRSRDLGGFDCMRSGRVVCMRRAAVDLKLEVHDREDVAEHVDAIDEVRRVENIKLCDRDRVWYIICRSIVTCVVVKRDVGFKVAMGERHRIAIGAWARNLAAGTCPPCIKLPSGSLTSFGPLRRWVLMYMLMMDACLMPLMQNANIVTRITLSYHVALSPSYLDPLSTAVHTVSRVSHQYISPPALDIDILFVFRVKRRRKFLAIHSVQAKLYRQCLPSGMLFLTALERRCLERQCELRTRAHTLRVLSAKVHRLGLTLAASCRRERRASA